MKVIKPALALFAAATSVVNASQSNSRTNIVARSNGVSPQNDTINLVNTNSSANGAVIEKKEEAVIVTIDTASVRDTYNKLSNRASGSNSIQTEAYTEIGQTQNVAGGTIVRENENTVSITGKITCDASNDASAKTINSVDNKGTIIPNANTVEVHNADTVILEAGKHDKDILISNFGANQNTVALKGYTGQITVSDPQERDDVPALSDKQYVQTIQHNGNDIAFIGYTNGAPITTKDITVDNNPVGEVTTTSASIVSAPTTMATSVSVPSATTNSAEPTASNDNHDENSGFKNALSKSLLSLSLVTSAWLAFS